MWRLSWNRGGSRLLTWSATWIYLFMSCSVALFLGPLKICIESNLVLDFEKCHFMVTKGIVLGHLISTRGIKVDKAKIDVMSSVSNPASIREVRSFLGHAIHQGFQQDRPTSVQASIERHGLCVRSALCGHISRAKEKTHDHAHPPSTKLGASVQLRIRSSLREAS
ncbi:Retrovirus-related Pol polyprotein from transposon opus, partial [Mucuna pruriens]